MCEVFGFSARRCGMILRQQPSYPQLTSVNQRNPLFADVFPIQTSFCTGDFPTIFDDTERKGRLLVVRRLTRMARPIACTACISEGLKGQPYMVRQRVQTT